MVTVREIIKSPGNLEERIITFFASPKSQLECIEAIGSEINFRIALMFIEKLMDEGKLVVLDHGKLIYRKQISLETDISVTF